MDSRIQEDLLFDLVKASDSEREVLVTALVQALNQLETEGYEVTITVHEEAC